MTKNKLYWHKVIAAAVARKRARKQPFTDSQINKAASWTTCACGKQDPRIPRLGKGEPADPELAELGSLFYDNVLNGQPGHAKKILFKIEKRAALVLEEALLRNRLEILRKKLSLRFPGEN